MKDIFDRVFNSNRSGSGRLLDDDELSIASFIYDVAHEEIYIGRNNFDEDDDDNISVLSFDEKVEVAMIKFERVVAIFKKSNDSKDHFLENFEKWAKICEKTIQSLKSFAEEMQKDKFNSDIARVVGGVVGTIGGVLLGISFLTPLAAVTVPLAIGGGVTSAVGGGLVAGTTGTEMVLVKNRLDKVKSLIEEEKERFSAISHWFSHPEELENAISSLVDYDVFQEVADEVRRFSEESDQKNMTDDELKQELKHLLKRCTGQLNQNNNLTLEYGKELAPVVITFIFVVCLMKDHNRIILDCVTITQRLALGMMSVMDFGSLAGALIGKLAAKSAANAIAKFAVAEIFTCLGIIIDVLNVVVSSIDIHNRTETVHTKKIREVADKFEKVFLFIESVYNETKKYKTPVDESYWSAVIVVGLPADAGHEDLKVALRQQLPEEDLRRIKLRRLPTKGNNWIVKIPHSHSEMLLKLTHVEVKGKNCVITE